MFLCKKIDKDIGVNVASTSQSSSSESSMNFYSWNLGVLMNLLSGR